MKYSEVESVDEKIKGKIEAARLRKYFVKREPHECSNLTSNLELIVNEYKSALEPWKKTTWHVAARNVKDFVESNIDGTVWNNVLDGVRNAVNEATAELYVSDDRSDAKWNATCNITRDAAWEIEKVDNLKISNLANPFEKLVEMYDMGLYPRRFRKVDGVEKFVVDFPLKIYKLGLWTERLGCWVEGDTEILYEHKWTESCRDIKPVGISRVIV